MHLKELMLSMRPVFYMPMNEYSNSGEPFTMMAWYRVEWMGWWRWLVDTSNGYGNPGWKTVVGYHHISPTPEERRDGGT